MASSGNAWRAHLYPETIDPTSGEGVLHNLFGEHDPNVLHQLGYDVVRDRQREIRLGLVEIPHTFDAADLTAIHRHLFQDVYVWAGRFRTVNLFKGTPRGFADVTTTATTVADRIAACAPDRLAGRTAVVTGGSSGIGLRCVEALARCRVEVVVPARDAGTAAVRLTGLPGVTVRAMDLMDPEAITAFLDWFAA
ncbi:MAG: SDR family NAD(P)-dependent oxidoreductase, partial [Micrococcales bacterium]|nr:SDR family NAD(P)-dependent oxidoreductase [Micrococcales bacterium]